MQIINIILGKPLGWAMYFCYNLVHNYGLTILFFTLLAKLVMFPVSLMLQKNSIKMVKLQPELKQLQRLYAGDKERISEEQFKLYEREGYNPAIGCLPTILQVIIVLGLIQVVYRPLEHIFRIDPTVIDELIAKVSGILGTELTGNSAQLRVIEAIQNTATSDAVKNLGLLSEEVFARVQAMNMNFLGLNLAETPNIAHPTPIIIVALASGLSSLLLCLVQNRRNVLQREQGKWSQWGMSAIVVAFGFYFAFLVPGGIGLYWTFSNLLAIVQLLIMNKIYAPEKYINYNNRENGELAAEESDEVVAARREREHILEERSRNDEERFFQTPNKLLVFYSEKSGFFDYFEEIINYLTSHTRIIIHYITSDPEDQIFTTGLPNIEPYYMNDKDLSKAFASMDADMVVMTTPDLNTFHIKRSVVRKDIEYIYVWHSLSSSNMTNRKGAHDHFDTIFCATKYQMKEFREAEKLYKLKEKKLIEYGYGLYDGMLKQYNALKDTIAAHEKPVILIAPSYQPGNIIESHLDSILEQLGGGDYKVIVRPHPQFVKRNPGVMEEIVNHYQDRIGEDLVFEVGYASHDSIYSADLLITDWSTTAIEFVCVTKNPVLFINTPMKVINPDYVKFENVPMEITMRSLFGKSLEESQVGDVRNSVGDLLAHKADYRQVIESFMDENLFNPGHSAEVGAKYIVNQLRAKKRR